MRNGCWFVLFLRFGLGVHVLCIVLFLIFRVRFVVLLVRQHIGLLRGLRHQGLVLTGF